MRHFRGLAGLGTGSALLMFMAVSAVAADETQPAVWVHHRYVINYDGFTAYGCTGIEDKVRKMLLYFGARDEGIKVSSTCGGILLVQTEFDSLATADEGQPGTVPARWIRLHMRPLDQGRGQCDLIRNLKGLLINSFTVRNMEYRTLCFPHDATLSEFEIAGQVLQPIEDRRRQRLRSAPLN